MKKWTVVFTALLLLIISSAAANNAIVHYKLDAYDRNIIVMSDGREISLSTKPLVIDGKIMISVKDAAYIFNKEVYWSSKYNIVNFGSRAKILDFPSDAELQKPKTAVKTQQQTVPYKYLEQMKVLRNVGPFYQLAKRKIAIAGERFNHGIVVDLDPTNNSQKTTDNKIKAEFKILLNQNYYALDGYLGVDDQTMNSKAGYIVRIYGDGDLLFTSDKIEPGDLPFRLTKDMIGSLNKVKVLKFELEQQDMGTSPGELQKTKAALADIKLYKKS